MRRNILLKLLKAFCRRIMIILSTLSLMAARLMERWIFIRKYKNHLTYWVSEPNKGLYDAMHKGLGKASGEIIGMINTNDYYSPGVFKIVAHAYKNQDLNHTVVWGDVMYKDKRIIGWNARNASLGTFAPHPSMFCPKSVYTRTKNYSMCYKILSNYEFMYRAIDYHNINY